MMGIVNIRGGFVMIKELFQLFRSFFTIGALTFGGGYAMLPMLEREVVEKHKWSTQEEILNYFAIGQCTPGIIAVNTATFVGYKQHKIVGAVAATLGVVAPSVLIITVIAMALRNFMDIVWVQHAFAGIRVAVCALIASSVWKLAKGNVKQWWHILLAVVAFVWVVAGQSPVWMVVACGVLGVVLGRKVKLA